MLPPEPIRRAIEERLPWFGEGLRAGWKPASGGLSDCAVWQVWLLDRDYGYRDRRYAVRRWWAGVDPRWLAWQAQTLRHAHQGGCRFVAQPLGTLGGDDAWPYRDAHDGHWEAAAWLPGEPLMSQCAPERVTSAVRGLALLHDRLRTVESPPIGGASGPNLAQRLESLPAFNSGLAASVAARWPEMSGLSKRLKSAREVAVARMLAVDEAALQRQVLHGDARPEHFLLEGSELTGLIDFGAMRVGSVLSDVARLAGELALGDAERFALVVEAYASATGRPIEIEAVRAFDAAGAVISAHNWIGWLSDPSFTPRDPSLVRQRLRSVLARLPDQPSSQ